MILMKVKIAGDLYWHYVLSAEYKPLCPCPCNSAGQPKRLGDTSCRCPCHQFGRRGTRSLCEKAGAVLQEGPRKPWMVVKGRDRTCPACQRLGVSVSKPDVDYVSRAHAQHEERMREWQYGRGDAT